MWPLMAALLLGSACCGSAQITFNVIKSVEYTVCNETLVIPCFATNVETKQLAELYVKWKFKGKDIFIFDGSRNQSTPSSNFTSAEITPEELLRGIASLKMKKKDAVPGNYTCEVTELSREGETTIQLKYRVVSWFFQKENILIIIFPILAILLFWGQFGVLRQLPIDYWHVEYSSVDDTQQNFNHTVSLCYSVCFVVTFNNGLVLNSKSSRMNQETISVLVAGLFLTMVVIVGAILFAPGEYSTKNASGLGLIVIPMVILQVLQYFVFKTSFEMNYFAIAILILQVLGFVLAVVGFSLCVSECVPVQGPLLISGLGIIALAELLGLVYMKFVAPNQTTTPPPRKAVEEPLNAFKESKGMMNDE